MDAEPSRVLAYPARARLRLLAADIAGDEAVLREPASRCARRSRDLRERIDVGEAIARTLPRRER